MRPGQARRCDNVDYPTVGMAPDVVLAGETGSRAALGACQHADIRRDTTVALAVATRDNQRFRPVTAIGAHISFIDPEGYESARTGC